MLPSANSKNTLFTYNFQHPVIYKKFFNNNNPNNLVFCSGLFGGCLFSSDITVSVLRDFEIPPDSSITEKSAEDTQLIEEAVEALETMKDTAETTKIEDEPASGIPKAKLKLVDVFSSYLTFLRESVLHVTRGKRAKVITWCKGKPTVKYLKNHLQKKLWRM
uniref:Uncharacterized protein n=1 Tax=Lygus hesperus TaxID=30085 RepID=A0A0K8SZ31_LYGHE